MNRPGVLATEGNILHDIGKKLNTGGLQTKATIFSQMTGREILVNEEAETGSPFEFFIPTTESELNPEGVYKTEAELTDDMDEVWVASSSETKASVFGTILGKSITVIENENGDEDKYYVVDRGSLVSTSLEFFHMTNKLNEANKELADLNANQEALYAKVGGLEGEVARKDVEISDWKSKCEALEASLKLVTEEKAVLKDKMVIEADERKKTVHDVIVKIEGILDSNVTQGFLGEEEAELLENINITLADI